MSAIIFTSQIDAIAFSGSMDARIGYPKNGIDVGGGVHAPAAQGRTVRHGNVLKHPTLAQWSYPNDQPTQKEVANGLAIPLTGSVQVKDATWDAATIVPDGK